MSMFGRDDDDDLKDDDGPMFGGAERYEKRKAAKERAREIASGISSGLFEKDEQVWEEVKKIKDE
jgi:hypothetical protein